LAGAPGQAAAGRLRRQLGGSLGEGERGGRPAGLRRGGGAAVARLARLAPLAPLLAHPLAPRLPVLAVAAAAPLGGHLRDHRPVLVGGELVAVLGELPDLGGAGLVAVDRGELLLLRGELAGGERLGRLLLPGGLPGGLPLFLLLGLRRLVLEVLVLEILEILVLKLPLELVLVLVLVFLLALVLLIDLDEL